MEEVQKLPGWYGKQSQHAPNPEGETVGPDGRIRGMYPNRPPIVNPKTRERLWFEKGAVDGKARA